MRLMKLWAILPILAMATTVKAGYIPAPEPVAESLGKAQTIVVVKIERYTPDIAPADKKPLPHVIMGGDDWVEALSFQDAGTYHVTLRHLLKGNSETEFDIHLPRVSSFDYANTKFPVGVGTSALLLLRKEQDKWVPVEPLRPVIPVAANVMGSDALDVMVASLADDSLRPTLMDILRVVKDVRVAAAAAKLGDDKELDTRAAALYCMAVNQDVSAIPKIGKLAVEMEIAKKGSGPVDALGRYSTPKAKEFLEPLAYEGTYYVRLNAVNALTTLADEKSIPFLIKAMGIDDPQRNPNRPRFIASQAYGTIRKVLGSQLPREEAYYLAHSKDDIQVIKAWWEQEQLKQP